MVNYRLYKILQILCWVIAISIIPVYIIAILIYKKDFILGVDHWGFLKNLTALYASSIPIFILYMTVKINRNIDKRWVAQLQVPVYKQFLENLAFDQTIVDNKEKFKEKLSWVKNTDFYNQLLLGRSDQKEKLKNLQELLVCNMEKLKEKSLRQNIISDFIKSKQNFIDYLAQIVKEG